MVSALADSRRDEFSPLRLSQLASKNTLHVQATFADHVGASESLVALGITVFCGLTRTFCQE